MKKAKSTTSEILNVYILLDRSGSMACRWGEAVSSVNSYVKQLEKEKTAALVSVAVFDLFRSMSFDIIRDKISPENWKDITKNEADPRGSTPLYDAVGRITTLAEQANKEKTVIVIMTDGYENSSRELNREAAKATLERCKSRGWQVVFLGADFDATTQAADVGISFSNTLKATAGNYTSSMRGMASMTTAYAATGVQMNVTEDLRNVALGITKPVS